LKAGRNRGCQLPLGGAAFRTGGDVAWVQDEAAYQGAWSHLALNLLPVLEFAFGFPPRLAAIRHAGIDYSINAIPFGGFVRILGQDDFSIEQRGAGAVAVPLLVAKLTPTAPALPPVRVIVIVALPPFSATL
jgi:hypothetical protein